MVQRTRITIIDDVDGETVAEETIQFGLDGVEYEIDLASDNAAELRTQIEGWANYARRIGGRRKRATNKSAEAAEISPSAEVRAWAQAQGLEVSERGRISADVQEAFSKAKG